MDNNELIVRLLKEKYDIRRKSYLIWKELDKLYDEYHHCSKGSDVAYLINSIVKCIDLADSYGSWLEEDDYEGGNEYGNRIKNS